MNNMNFKEWIGQFETVDSYVLSDGIYPHDANPSIHYHQCKRPYKNEKEDFIFLLIEKRWVKTNKRLVFFTKEDWQTAYNFCFQKTKEMYQHRNSIDLKVYEKDGFAKMPILTTFLRGF